MSCPELPILGPFVVELTTATIPDADRLAAALAQEYGLKPHHVFHAGFFSGIPAEQLAAVRADARVRQVRKMEPNERIPDHYGARFHDGVADAQQTAMEMAQEYGFELRHVYQVATKGF